MTDWQEQQRRIRRARKLAKQLGVRLSNLRGLDGSGDGGWVLAVPRSFDEVEAELLVRMRQREHVQDHTYTRAYPPVRTDMEEIENGDGEVVPVQYISVNTCRQCGAMVHDEAAHNSWHTWMRSLHGWMARHRHDHVTSPTPANERDQSPLRRLQDDGSNRQSLRQSLRQARKEGRIEVVPESAAETVAIRRSRVQQALTSLGTNTSPAKLAQHLHMDVWEVREHLRALEITGLNTVAPKEDQ
jgi:hypothetical protein